MTVKELIQVLNQHPGNLAVMINGEGIQRIDLEAEARTPERLWPGYVDLVS